MNIPSGCFSIANFEQTYVSYKPNIEYLVVSTCRQTYTLQSDRELRQCEGDTVRSCSADKAVISTQIDSCALSLFFQRRNVRGVTKGSLPPSRVAIPDVGTTRHPGYAVHVGAPDSRRDHGPPSAGRSWFAELEPSSPHYVGRVAVVCRNAGESTVRDANSTVGSPITDRCYLG